MFCLVLSKAHITVKHIKAQVNRHSPLVVASTEKRDVTMMEIPVEMVERVITWLVTVMETGMILMKATR
jgi:hypothetical protein